MENEKRFTRTRLKNLKCYRWSLFLVLLLFASIVARSQCFESNKCFQEGESAVYKVSYSWGPIWVDAGLVTFAVTKEKFNDQDAYHLKSSGKTYSSYDLFFKVRDYYDSWIDPQTFKTFEFRRYTYEGGYTLLNTLRPKPEKGLIYSNTKTNNNPVRYDTLKLIPCSYDMLSAVYFTRTLPLGDIKKDLKLPVQVLIDDGYYSIYVRSIGREIIENTDGKKYRCIKFSAKMVQGTIFKGDEDALIWVTDDENKVPIRIEAKIIVGTVKAFLKEVKGLRNPMSSLVR